MLTLRRPFEGDTSQQVLGQILLADPVDPQKLRSMCPAELAVICLKAMEKQPQHRYQTAAEFRNDLQRFLEHRTILARPPSLARRLQKWAQRHPSFAFGIAGTVVALTVISILLVKTLEAREAAEDQTIVALLEAEHARASARNLEEVAMFVTDIFRGQLLSRTSREVLESKGFLEAAEQEVLADSQLNEEARTQRLEIVGRLYGTIGLNQKAEELLRAGLEWRRRSYGETDLRTIHTQVLLAEAVLGLEAWSEAEGLASDAERVLLEADKPDHLDIHSANQILARIQMERGQAQEAEANLTRVLARRRELLGTTHPKTLETLVSLAVVRYENGRMEQGHALLLEAGQQCLSAGRDSDRRRLVLRTLRQMYDAQSRPHDEPSGSELQAIESGLQILDPMPVLFQDPTTEFDEDAFLAVLPVVAGNLDDGPGTLSAIGQAANGVSAAGHTRQAFFLFSLVLSVMQEVHGPAYHDSVACLGNLANAYTDLGRIEEAAAYHRRNVTLSNHVNGPRNGLTVHAELWCAANESLLGNYDEAEAMLLSVADRSERAVGPEHWMTMMATVELARVYTETGRTDEALPMLEFAYETLRGKYGADHPYTEEALTLVEKARG